VAVDLLLGSLYARRLHASASDPNRLPRHRQRHKIFDDRSHAMKPWHDFHIKLGSSYRLNGWMLAVNIREKVLDS